ncbi:MAG: glutaredoxin family protein [Nitrospiraceae bacterium]|nr:MAG: glutaredoxin family protein [Nitrospiraceae bacterium]
MYCNKVKEYLSQKGVTYTERNLATDPTAIYDLGKMGIRTLPVTLINNEAVTGFDQGKIDELLNK